MAAAPWDPVRGVDPVLRYWLANHTVRPCLEIDELLAGREEKSTRFPEDLPKTLARALEGRGIKSLYTHQAEAFRLGQAKKSFVVATPTASGKSLCFHLPILTRLLENPDARAIYLFPTKALARDQENNVRELMRTAGIDAPVVVYDGDTPADARRAGRERSRILLTNPDMLHTGILPHHASWSRTFQNLTHIVVDEMHMYKGVFGSNFANVLRRLQRVAAFHGSRPNFIGATATIGNPVEHAANLFGLPKEDVALVHESGAPSGDRRFFLFNPPVVNEELGIRASYMKQAVMLAADLVKARVPTLIFAHSRNNVEVMLRYLRDKVAGEINADQIMGYRGGYLPETRRDIEQRLREGKILGVVATNALELGIDIGELDAVICAGYPGSIAGMWQRFGRAGRRKQTSIAVLVTTSAPLDQFLAREPSYLLGAPVEEARVDPSNVEILIQHMKCAAFELPFQRGEAFGKLTKEETEEALSFLERHDVVHRAGNVFHWSADAYPANNVSLRSIGWDNVVIIDAENDRNIAEIDFRGAHTMLHEQAIYQHDGECFQVEKFDYENHKAFVRKVKPDYFTDAMTHVTLSVLEEAALADGFAAPSVEAPVAEASPAQSETDADSPREARGETKPAANNALVWSYGHGEVALVEKVVGYKKIKFYTHENTGYGEVRLPEQNLHTTAFWMTLPDEAAPRFGVGKASLVDALRGVGIALEIVATISLMTDPRDIGAMLSQTREAVPPSARDDEHGTFRPTLFLYEHVPGGVGLAERMFDMRAQLLKRTRRLIASCACRSGCPVCVGPAGGDDASRRMKALAQFGVGDHAEENAREEESGVWKAANVRGRKELALLLLDSMLAAS